LRFKQLTSPAWQEEFARFSDPSYPNFDAIRPAFPEMPDAVERALSDLVFVARALGATETSWLLFQAKPRAETN